MTCSEVDWAQACREVADRKLAEAEVVLRAAGYTVTPPRSDRFVVARLLLMVTVFGTLGAVIGHLVVGGR